MSEQLIDVRFSVDDDPNIRRDYQLALGRIRRSCPDAAHCIGLKNPYTGEVIRSNEDYELYLRQRALSFAYAARYARAQQELDAILIKREHEFVRRESDMQEKIRRLERGGEGDRKRAVRRGVFAAVLALVLVVLSVYFHPKDIADARSAGEAAGYSSGYNAGQSAGYKDGSADGYARGVQSGYDAGYSSGASNSGADAPSVSGSSGSRLLPSLSGEAPKSDMVYVSRNGVIHTHSNCSGMKYYTEMTYSEAIAAGYRKCSKCY